MFRRWVTFNLVGGLGVLVQLGVLSILVGWMEWHYLFGTALAVEAAVLHNFLWHEHWTWADRTADARGAAFGRFLAFNLANGGISITGNLLLMRILVGGFAMHYAAANLLTIVVCSILNFLAGDRFVFAPSGSRRGSADGGPNPNGVQNPCPKQDSPESPAAWECSSFWRRPRPSRPPS
jgi:putative flippase GtrA